MAFTLKTADNQRYTWYVNQKKPQLNFDFPANRIIFFRADGHELEAIERRFNNLPITHAMCIWRDGLAQFVFENL